MLKSDIWVSVANGEEEASEAAERGDERQEDHEENDVCSKRNNHVDKAQYTHVDMEKAEGRGKDWIS